MMETKVDTQSSTEEAVADKQSADIGTEAPATEGRPAEPIRGANGRFLKGSPAPKGVGRKRGVPNRFTRSIKETFEGVFKDLQKSSKTNLMAWAKANPGDFYKLANRLVEKNLSIKQDEEQFLAQQRERLAALDKTELARRFAFFLAEAQREKRLKAAQAPALPAPVDIKPVKQSDEPVLDLHGEPVGYREVAPESKRVEPEDYALGRALDQEQIDMFSNPLPSRVIPGRWGR